jgi:hypothetical protein
MDDILGLKPGWLERFASVLEGEGLRIPFKSLNRADLLLEGQAIPALQRAGAEIVWIGAESGSQKILDAMERGAGQRREATRRLHAPGSDRLFLQFGYPSETWRHQQTLHRCECKPDDIGISVSYAAWHRFYGRCACSSDKTNWVDSGRVYHGPYSTEFYRKLRERTHQEFRLRHAWRELGEARRAPQRVRARHIRLAATMLYHWLTLPGARRALKRLARTPQAGLAPLQPVLDPQAAARPTPQGDDRRRPQRTSRPGVLVRPGSMTISAATIEPGAHAPPGVRPRAALRPAGLFLEINAGTGRTPFSPGRGFRSRD